MTGVFQDNVLGGVPIPIFYCKECGKEYATNESFEKGIKNI